SSTRPNHGLMPVGWPSQTVDTLESDEDTARGSTSDAARVQPAHVEDAGHPRHAWTEFSAGTAPSVADALCGRFSGVRLVHQETRHPTAVDTPADDSRLAVEQCGPRPVPGLLQLSPEARVA